MEPCAAAFLGAVAQAAAQVFVALRAGEEAIGERAQVEAGSSRYDGEAAATGDVAQGGAGQAAVIAGGEGLVGIGDIDEMMRQASALLVSGLGGSQVNAAVDGNRVATDDFGVELFTESEGERGLAAACGTEEENG